MADINMDVDMEIDFGEGEIDPEIARLDAEAAALAAKQKENEANEAMNGVEEAQEEGEVDLNATVPKVHITGVNELSTRDLGNYAREHYSEELFKHVQWVNDSSANLVYDTPIAAAEALQAFSTEDVADPLQMRPAKRLSTHPDIELSVRQARESDVKVKNAHIYSRYYMDQPDIDPENPHGNRRGKRRFEERGYRTRDYSFKRRRPDREDDRYSRRSSHDEPFDVDLYDDNPEARAKVAQRKDSYSSGDERRRKVHYQDELFPAKDNGRLRDRSASPTRDDSGLYGFTEEHPRRRTARPRSPTPPRLRASTNRGARDLLRKELFPDKKSGALTNGHSNGNDDLFPNHSSPSKGTRELFPGHKRQEARDLDSEYRKVGDAIDSRNNTTTNGKPRDMFQRMGLKVESNYGRLQDRTGSSDQNSGYTFKGAGGGGNGGFSILGASRDKSINPLVKELFPLKSGGGGKDLFDVPIKGRGRQKRSQAEDLF